jgi:16S rRNA (uracil1498-N3)-methyltransferase
VAHFYLAEQVGEPDSLVELSGEEARHAATVARLRTGEQVHVGDGRGRVAVAEATAVGRDAVTLVVRSVETVPEPTPRIHLVQALAKGGRDELAIQAATELGVTSVAPWQAARSVPRWTGAKAGSGAARWASIVREASKQAMRPWTAEGRPLVSTADLVRLAGTGGMVLLDPDATLRLVDAVPRGVDDLVLIVGPEGGVSPEEAAALTAAGATPARMGPTVLRTSTAAAAALAALAVHLDLWP